MSTTGAPATAFSLPPLALTPLPTSEDDSEISFYDPLDASSHSYAACQGRCGHPDHSGDHQTYSDGYAPITFIGFHGHRPLQPVGVEEGHVAREWCDTPLICGEGENQVCGNCHVCSPHKS
jgi:hypothetical protein